MRIKGLLTLLLFFPSCVYAESSIGVSEVVNLNQAPLDFSPKSLYLQAHIVVQIVIWLLVFCSVITWAMLFFKSYQFIVSRFKVKQDLQTLSRSSLFSEMEKETNYSLIAQGFLHIVAQEKQLSSPQDKDLIERIEYRLAQQSKIMQQHLRYGIGILASIGAVTPFVGLFGTVWGIMNSFIGIAQTQSADLFAVAPGIAEALFATALGLIAAIPAVVIYNFFVRQTQNYGEQLQRITALILLAIRRENGMK
ncbi:biopolymer transport protein ExbB [Volucribacter psittacicida]|uniref:Biopolymer transport protein ExbB n=1 Tax=Volucribacter psittacicida TaxID=203482 RepID=A0A4R1G5G8_9PAST|nr:tonB-system energizer ExbB [Volucribacter psittacicida]TCK01685.1 biopolymer transport protein ExbB [Volucribacter psittacicida]